jgi:hypothetical protein
MEEINRGVALLGPKTQECNTGDKRLLRPTCIFGRSVGLLSVSGADALVAGRMMQGRLYHPPIPLARIGRTERHQGDRGPNGLQAPVC